MFHSLAGIGFCRRIVTRQALKPSNNIVKSVPNTTSHADKRRSTTIEPVLFGRGLGFTRQLTILFLT
ncbi:MAG: hypothetical protein ABSD38_38570 [Syntrophorhabdales bacterium]